MNITTTIVDIGHGLAENGNLGVLNFTVVATADSGETARYEVSQVGGDFPPPATADYTQAELASIAEAVATARDAHTTAKSRLETMLLKPLVYTPPAVHVPTDAERKQLLADQIDNRVKFIYNRFMAFRMEYELREAAALAFKNGGYAGQPDALVKRFADNSGMGYQAATDLILAQSANLRNAIPTLGNLRMDKYLVTRAATLEAAQAAFDTTMAAIDTIDRSLA